MDKKVEERLATITEHLVSFPTVDGNNRDLHGCVDWVKARVLTQSPRLDIRGFCSHDKPSLLFSAGKTPPKVLLCGHLDVVEAPKPEFTASIVGESRMRGRGTADMKGPVAALIDIMATEPIPGLGLLVTTDEEVGGENGVNHVLNSLDWRPDVVILPDGGANMRLVGEQKGILRLRLIAKGGGAHGSRPWLSNNPIISIQRAYDALLRAYPMPKEDEDWRVSISLTELHAGVAPNSIPWHAEATLDIRFPDAGEGTWEKLLIDMRRRLARYDVSAEVVANSPGFKLDVASPAVRQMQDVAQYVYGKSLPVVREAGASDARYFSSENIPVIMFQPECGNWHGSDEWVDLESLAMFRTMCTSFARTMLGRDRGIYQVAHAPRKTRASAHKRSAAL
jgi:succinyl-diaminopimelate desuccinylase